jgi:HAE1 family hydrophobic/amphiphilic exporter-1
VQLPDASSLQRTSEIAAQAEELIMKVPGVQYTTTVVGYSMLSQVTNTYSAFFFVTLKNWADRKQPEEQYAAIKAELTKRLASIPGAIAFAFPPPAIQGVGTSGGATFILQDRAGKDIAFLAENTTKFIEAAKKRPELASVSTTFRPTVPQLFIDVDQDKVLKQGVLLSDVYKTCRASSAAASSTTSTASDASGRCMCRPRATTARTSRMSASSTCATTRAKRCRCRR